MAGRNGLNAQAVRTIYGDSVNFPETPTMVQQSTVGGVPDESTQEVQTNYGFILNILDAMGREVVCRDNSRCG